MKENITSNTALTGSKENLDLLDKLFTDPVFFIETFLWVKNKSGKVVPFILNPIQRKYVSLNYRFSIILKARQLGITTILLALEFRKAIFNPGTNALIMAQDNDTTQRMFDTIKLFYDNLPDYIKPVKKYSNRKELYFYDPKNPSVSLNSRLFISSPGTNKNTKVGRSATINALHLTEVAFWDNLEEVLSGLLESTPLTDNETTIVLESTPNGENYFYNLYSLAKTGKSMFKPVFFPWYENDEYRLPLDPLDNFDTYFDEDEKEYAEKLHLTKEALKWRRNKMSFYARNALAEFRKEYPKDDISCFKNFNNATTFPEKSYLYLNYEIREPEDKLNIFRLKDFKAWEELNNIDSYIISIDPAEGHTDSDLTALEVFKIKDENKLVQVCELASKISPIELGRILLSMVSGLSNYLVVIERNTGSALHFILAENGISNIYIHSDGYEGFPMNRVSKPIIISKFLSALLKKEIIIYSKDLYKEIQFYNEVDKDKRLEDGSHFDRLIASMIANFVVDKIGVSTADIGTIDLNNAETIEIA